MFAGKLDDIYKECTKMVKETGLDRSELKDLLNPRRYKCLGTTSEVRVLRESLVDSFQLGYSLEDDTPADLKPTRCIRDSYTKWYKMPSHGPSSLGDWNMSYLDILRYFADAEHH